MNRRTLAVVGILVVALGATSLAAGAAKKAKPKNGGFESGNLSRWHVTTLDEDPGSTWSVYSGTALPQPDLEMRGGGGGPTTFFAPPQGEFGAVTIGGAGTKILYRKLKLADDSRHKLKLWVAYRNSAELFASPDTLDSEVEPNQQYRVDILRKNAPIDSVEDSDVLKRIFATEPGDPFELAPTKLRVNLTKFAGKKVRLRFAEVDNQFYFNAGADGVKLKSKPKK